MNHRQHSLTIARIVPVFVVAIPALIYVIHVLQFGAWIVDDAAITFAYARNFAFGHGLVSQPGMPAVEGYSNFAWLALLSPFFRLGIFDPVLTPKLISIVLVVLGFAVLTQSIKPLPGSGWIAFAGLTLTALNTSFVVWTISGLENPLYFLLVTLLVRGTASTAVEQRASKRSGVLLGILVALVSMTRPDGLAFVVAFPTILVLARRVGFKRKLLVLVAYGAAFACVYGLFIAFRLAYFGAPLPNTYYMKGGPGLDDVISLLTLQREMVNKLQLLTSALGHSSVPLVALILGSLYLLITRQWTRQGWTVFVFMMCALGIYLLLPPDWMGEYRFATVFFPLLYLLAALVVVTILRRLPARVSSAALVIVTLVATGAAFQHFSPRTEAFRLHPTVSFQYIQASFADRFAWYSESLGITSGSVLLPDVGGMIYASNMKVYDLAGLTDATVARTLGTTINRPAFYDYVFDEVQPTFIHTHGFWTVLSRLEHDPRFAALYVAICAYDDPYAAQTYNMQLQSGDFVLRSIAAQAPDQMAAIRQRLDQNCNFQGDAS